MRSKGEGQEKLCCSSLPLQTETMLGFYTFLDFPDLHSQFWT